MLDRTQQVIALLGDAICQQTLRACREQGCTRPKLGEMTGVSQATLGSRLQLLEAHGLLRRGLRREGERGRPVEVWEERAAEELRRFEQTADAFALDLLEGLRDEQADGIRSRARGDLRTVDETDASKQP